MLTIARQEDEDESWLLAKGVGTSFHRPRQGVLHRLVASFVPCDFRNGLTDVGDTHLGTLIQQVDDEVLQCITHILQVTSWQAVCQLIHNLTELIEHVDKSWTDWTDCSVSGPLEHSNLF